MTFPQLMTTQKSIHEYTGDLIIFLAREQKDAPPVCDPEVAGLLQTAHTLGDFSGKEGQTLLVYPEQARLEPAMPARRILVVGVGSTQEENHADPEREALRKAGGTMAGIAHKCKAADVMVRVPSDLFLSIQETGECLAEGLVLGNYRFTKYKKEKTDDPPFKGIESIRFFTDASPSPLRKGLKLGGCAAEAACSARDMANEPGNGWTASDFAQRALSISETHGLKFSVLNHIDMEKLGMGGLLGVNQGSSEPAKMVILQYRPDTRKETLLLVGKGITFDSGGISLKPPAGMEDMKYDMCGGAAVLAAMEAVGREKPDVGVVAIVPATDNMSGAGAIKPGDIIRHFNGVTSEIVNTDAEGRMILADALAYGIEKFSPTAVIDIATLTGAAIVGLGHHYSAILGNNDALAECLRDAGERCGEPVWRLPMGKPYAKQIESKVADIKNVGGKGAGTITAACYLEHFVGDTPWIHMDIAGTAWDFTEKSYIPKGPSGMGTRTFIDLIRNWKTGVISSS